MTGSPTEVKLAIWARLALGICLFQPPNAEITGICVHAQLFGWILEIQTQVPMLAERASYPMHHLLNPGGGHFTNSNGNGITET